MELKQLQAFTKVVELHNFSLAAKALYLTQPTVSAHVSTLEKELNTRLLERTTKHVKTTAEGEKLYRRAKEMLEIKNEIENDFLVKEAADTVLLLSASTIPSFYVLPEIVAAYQKLQSGVQFHLTQTDSAGAIEDLLSHKADLAFTGMAAEDERLACVPFMKDRLVVITPNEERYRQILHGKHVWDTLLHEPMILRENGSGTRKEAERFLAMQGISEDSLHITARINDQETIKRAVSQGMGISIISGKAAEDYVQMGKLLEYEPEEAQIWRNLYIVSIKNRKPEKKIKNFIDFTLEYFKERG